MTPIERVAAAIEAEIKRQSDLDGHHFRGRDHEDWIAFDGNLEISPLARAALEALREPSEDIKIAGALNGGFHGYYGDDADNRATAEEVWRAQINAALKEGPE